MSKENTDTSLTEVYLVFKQMPIFNKDKFVAVFADLNEAKTYCGKLNQPYTNRKEEPLYFLTEMEVKLKI